jgi:uncharacterized protein YigE (DUF2233 family)
MMKKLLAILALLLLCAAGRADERPFTVVRVDLASQNLELFLKDEQGIPFNQFDRLQSWLATKHRRLLFAMNAGMYHADFSPVGLFVSNGKQESPLNLATGEGNFFLMPNGVFLVSKSGPRVIESSEYATTKESVRLATQSGPLLVRNGVIHPAFNPQSTSRLIRNGVGVSGNRVFFVMSDRPVTFYEFAQFFRDSLGCPDALYLDGVISGMFSTDLNRRDSTRNLGPIIAIVE